ncbi:MAG TPA: outer membrane protein assembly factor BamA [Kiloniellales bacterium]|nr:outer membrane protein assembly factor BamA [Kiloniellales bacterium]
MHKGISLVGGVAFALSLGTATLLTEASLAPAAAQQQPFAQGEIIQEIRIEGTQRVDPATVLSYMQVSPGDPYDPFLVDDSLKSIFDTGLFADVTLLRQGNVLVVDVVENPMINRIAFEGNDRIDDDALEAEIELRPRVVYTRTRVQQDVQRILDLYQRRGRFAASVQPQLIELDQNRVDLVFEIEEGPVTEIDSINFVGNNSFSAGTLRGVISTRESAWYRFLSSSDVYDPDRLAFDRELLRRFYLEEGYADFRVVSAVAELNLDRSGFIITFTVEEGERYRFGEIDLVSELRGVDAEELLPLLTMSEGDWYDAVEVEDSVEEITEYLAENGYPFVNVNPRPTRSREERTIGITFEVSEGPRVFVERIDIEGNVRTVDSVIRREFRLVEGDAFNSALVRRSRERLEALGYFRTIDVQQEEGSAPDRTVVKVEVEEQSTGELSFGAGFSTSAGPLGQVELRERNLLGRGQEARIAFMMAGRGTEFDVGFTEPRFLGRELSAGVDAFHVTTEVDESGFDRRSTGGGFRFGYDLTEYTRQVLSYQLERRQISDVDDDAPLSVRRDEGTDWRSTVGQTLTWDRRDSVLDPREGFLVSLDTDVAGLGGNVRFARAQAEGRYFQPLSDDFTFVIGASGGAMHGLGQDTRISDRFMLGADSFRGFEYGGIGPREGRYALGGRYFAKGLAEFRFPLGLPEEFDVRGRLFADFGTLWGVDGADKDAKGDNGSIRVSVGPGVTWNSPLGLINIDLGYAVRKEDYDKTELLNFSIGATF